MTKRVLHTGAHLWNVRCVTSGLVFEQGTYNASPILFHVVPGQRPREIARLPLGRPRGVLQAVEDDRMICVESDGVLSAIDLRGNRQVLRHLKPMPAAVAITPEQVVWAVSETRFLDGAGTREGTGQVWRWWRGTDDVELLGEQPSFRPDLAVGGIAAGPSEMSSPIYIAADHELGVIDTHGLRWLARSEQPITQLACSGSSVFYVVPGSVLQRDHATGLTQTIHRETIPMGVAIHDHRLVVTRNSVIDRRQLVESSAVSVIDLRGGPAHVLATDLARPGALAVGDAGIALVEGALDYGGTDRLVLIDWDSDPIAQLAPTELDDAIWQSPFAIQWWHPDGQGGYFSLDRQGDWRLHGTDAYGQVGIDVLRRFEGWLAEWQADSGTYVDLSTNRGWLVTWGLDAWFRGVVAGASPQARAVAAARDLVVSVCPAFADIVRAMP